MRIERHVFGSFSGYTTLARSAGLSADDSRFLEGASFSFGQTSDSRYLKSLRKYPAWFTRNLRSGRRGLTRVLEGTPDDNGRPTLLMITAAITQREWDSELCGDVQRLLDDAEIWTWEGSQLLPIDRIFPLPNQSVPRKSVPRLLALLSEVERQSAGGRQSIVVSAADFGEEELTSLEMLIPPAARPNFTAACRSLSATLQVHVNCLAAEADSQTITFRPQTGLPLSPYAQFLQGTSFASGALPLAEVMGYRTFGRREAVTTPVAVAAAAPAMPAPIVIPVSRGTSKALVAAMILLCFVTSGAGYFVGWKNGQKQVAQTPPPGQTSPLETPPSNPAPATTVVAPPGAEIANTPPATVPATPTTRKTGNHTGNTQATKKESGHPKEHAEEIARLQGEVDKWKRDFDAKKLEADGLQADLKQQKKQAQSFEEQIKQLGEHGKSTRVAFYKTARAQLAWYFPENNVAVTIPLNDLAGKTATLEPLRAAWGAAAKHKDESADARWLADHEADLQSLFLACDGLNRLKSIRPKLQSDRESFRHKPSPDLLEKISANAKASEEALTSLPDHAPRGVNEKQYHDARDAYDQEQKILKNWLQANSPAQKTPATQASNARTK